MPLFTGTHIHRHGESTYVFEADEMAEADFIDWLGDEYEADLEGESVQFEQAQVIKFESPQDSRIEKPASTREILEATNVFLGEVERVNRITPGLYNPVDMDILTLDLDVEELKGLKENCEDKIAQQNAGVPEVDDTPSM